MARHVLSRSAEPDVQQTAETGSSHDRRRQTQTTQRNKRRTAPNMVRPVARRAVHPTLWDWPNGRSDYYRKRRTAIASKSKLVKTLFISNVAEIEHDEQSSHKIVEHT